MRRRALIAMLGGAAVAWPLAARAQQRVRRVGWLVNFRSAIREHVPKTLRSCMEELGYPRIEQIILASGRALLGRCG